ncbi:MAG: hypothetical protein R3C60_10260 [Parvularculaceae bacterium]
MILRRITAAFKRQDWFTVGIETLIVVLGVFLGLQVNNWNAAREGRRAEAQYLSQLQGDLHNIEGEINAQIEFEKFQTNLATDVFDLIRNGDAADRAQKISMGLNQLIVRRTLRTQSPTFLDLQGSGRLELISDPVLRAAIISYFYRTSRLEAAVDKNNEFFVDQGFNVFVWNKSVPARPWNNALMKEPLPTSSELDSAFAVSAKKSPLYAAGGAFLAAPPDAAIWKEVIAQLTWRGTIAINNEGLAEELRAETQELEAKLAAQLERRAR